MSEGFVKKLFVLFLTVSFAFKLSAFDRNMEYIVVCVEYLRKNSFSVRSDYLNSDFSTPRPDFVPSSLASNLKKEDVELQIKDEKFHFNEEYRGSKLLEAKLLAIIEKNKPFRIGILSRLIEGGNNQLTFDQLERMSIEEFQNFLQKL